MGWRAGISYMCEYGYLSEYTCVPGNWSPGRGLITTTPMYTYIYAAELYFMRNLIAVNDILHGAIMI